MKILLIEDHPDSRRNLCRLIDTARTRSGCLCQRRRGRSRDRAGEISVPHSRLDASREKAESIFVGNCAARPNGDEMYILLVTARGDAEDLEQALAAGANDYLTKPLDTEA